MVPGGLLERKSELARVDRLLTTARTGRGGVVVITGPAGIGKTALLTEAEERAGRAGMRVLAGRGGELEGGFSFGVARQLFEPLLTGAAPADEAALLAGAARRGLIALGDETGAAPSAAGNERLFTVVHGLYWLVVNASGAGPVLVVVDDLHWADQASLRFVLYLAGRLAGLPVALALSWRAAETGDGMSPLSRLEQIAADGVVSLTPLSRSGVQTLLIQEFGTAPAERFAEACHAVTGGNAFLLREMIQQLRADGIGPDEEAAAQVAALGPRSVARAVALRVARLGPAAGELARAAAVLGDGAQLRHAAVLAGWAWRTPRRRQTGWLGSECSNRARRCGSCTRSCARRYTTTSRRPAGACVTPRRRGCWPPRARTLTRCARTCSCASRPDRPRWWSVCRRLRRGRSGVERRKARLPICGGRWRRRPM